jgi:hypothetical protein
MSLVTTLVPFLVFRNSKVCRATPFSFFCSWIRLAAVVNTMRGGRLNVTGAGAAASSALESATGASSLHTGCPERGVEVARGRHGWWCYASFFRSAGCLSRGVSLSATGFLESVRLFDLSCLAACL